MERISIIVFIVKVLNKAVLVIFFGCQIPLDELLLVGVRSMSYYGRVSIWFLFLKTDLVPSIFVLKNTSNIENIKYREQ